MRQLKEEGWELRFEHEPVQHGPQDLGSHDEATGRGVDGDVARHQPHVGEDLAEITKLLVGQRFERRRVDDTLVVAEAGGDGVSAHNVTKMLCNK